jgi:hypothetical protein
MPFFYHIFPELRLIHQEIEKEGERAKANNSGPKESSILATKTKVDFHARGLREFFFVQTNYKF